MEVISKQNSLQKEKNSKRKSLKLYKIIRFRIKPLGNLLINKPKRIPNKKGSKKEYFTWCWSRSFLNRLNKK